MKKFLITLFTSFTAVLAWGASFDNFVTVEIDGNSYDLDAENGFVARVRTFVATPITVIPSEIEYEGDIYKVVDIVERFFYDGSRIMEELYLPNEIERIGKISFRLLPKLKKVVIPASLKTIPPILL